MFCSNCGTQIPDHSRFCAACGKAAGMPPEQAPAPKSTVPNAPRQRITGRKKTDISLIFTIINCAVIVLSVGAYFLFLRQGAPASMPPVPSAALAAVTAAPAARPELEPTPLLSPGKATETVSEKIITVDMDYDSGEGIYTGEIKQGVPHGQGSFTMQKSDNGLSWSYEGEWENGVIAGEGVKKEGHYTFTGSFKGGLSDGYCKITDNGILRYEGTCRNGSLHGAGTLYTKSGRLIFEGTFENDMLVESEADRKRRSEAFKPECEDMDELMYGVIMDGYDSMDYPVHVWGFPLGMAEQAASGTIVIGHFADGGYPVCLLYRYVVGERKMTGDDWINAWGVVTGLFEYTDANGNPAICPQVEVIYWDSEQEGL